ncbi:Arc family DNA-binding protein [Pseudomonas sp. Marseille-Q8238]
MQAKPQETGEVKTTTFAGNSRSADKFVLRMPDGMRSRIEHLAAASHRSMNSEIIVRLERSFITTDLIAEQRMVIDALKAQVSALSEALEDIVQQYPNPDISHVDYRVHACKHAEAALTACRTAQGGAA